MLLTVGGFAPSSASAQYVPPVEENLPSETDPPSGLVCPEGDYSVQCWYVNNPLIDDPAADLGTSFDELALDSSTCAVQVATSQVPVVAYVRSARVAAGSAAPADEIVVCGTSKSGTVFYVPPRRINSGEFFAGGYGKRISNWFVVRDCASDLCTVETQLRDKNNNKRSGYTIRGSCETCYVGHDFTRTKGRPYCYFPPPNAFRGEIRRGSCYYAY